MTDTSRRLREPPLSPHLQVWRWHVTMLTSILHRASGVGLYGGALILGGWAVALAAGPECYGTYKAVLGSFPGKVVMFLLTLAVFYHLANGVRHLVWDTGHGLDLRTANFTAVFVIALAGVATVALWIAAALMGVL